MVRIWPSVTGCRIRMPTTHRARLIQTDSQILGELGVDLARTTIVRGSNKNKGECLMETNTQDELKAHLMATSEEFRGLADKHAQLHKQLEHLEAKQHLTDQEQLDEVQIKKQKLRLKDQMNAVLARYKAEHVA
jgi:uncharacterized protein YdcH (DUF465 family)